MHVRSKFVIFKTSETVVRFIITVWVITISIKINVRSTKSCLRDSIKVAKCHAFCNNCQVQLLQCRSSRRVVMATRKLRLATAILSLANRLV